jgi:hypothetical protein
VRIGAIGQTRRRKERFEGRHMSIGGAAPARQARSQGKDLARSQQLEWLARAGLAARGVNYAIIAILALKLALGDGGKATNQQGAMRTIAAQPMGKVLLVVLAIGLFGYAAWRLTRAAIGHGRESSDDTKERVSGAVSGVVYAALCVTAVQILVGSGGSSGHPDKAAGGVLQWPAGRWLVVLAGVVMVGVAIEQAHKGLARKFCEKSKTEQMGEGMRTFFTGAGVFGHLARAVVFALIGYFLAKAAIDFDPNKAVGLDGALAKLGQASFGPLVLGVVAAGLLAFAVYSALDARYRKV